jgi:hypothetical protein
MQTSSERVNEGLCVAGFRCGWCGGENSSREQHLVKYAYTLRLTYVGVVAHVLWTHCRARGANHRHRQCAGSSSCLKRVSARTGVTRRSHCHDVMCWGSAGPIPGRLIIHLLKRPGTDPLRVRRARAPAHRSYRPLRIRPRARARATCARLSRLGTLGNDGNRNRIF